MPLNPEFDMLVFEPWRSEYIAYKSIHEGLQRASWTPQDNKNFESAIRLEANKVNQFIYRKQREIETRIGHCERLLSNQAKFTDSASAHRMAINEGPGDILIDIHRLSTYTHTNFKALNHLIQLREQYTNINGNTLLVEISRICPLDCQRFDGILLAASLLIDKSYIKEEIKNSKNNQSIFAKYWVHPDYLAEVKSILLFNLPVKIPQVHPSGEQSEESVYFDDDRFNHYLSHLQRDDNMEIVRLHWKGDFSSPDTNVNLEQSLYKQSNLPTVKAKKIDKAQLYDALWKSEKGSVFKDLKPKIRVCLNRLIYQSDESGSVTVMLDQNVRFIKADNFPQDALSQKPVNCRLFPYAVMEIQLNCPVMPIWLDQLISSNLVFEVPRFSYDIQGIVEFYCEQQALLPWWMKANIDIRTQNSSITKDANGIAHAIRSDFLSNLSEPGYIETQLGKKRFIETYNEQWSTDKFKVNEKNISRNKKSDNNTLYNHSSTIEQQNMLIGTVQHVEHCQMHNYKDKGSANYTHYNGVRSRSAYTSQNSDQQSTFMESYQQNRNNQSEGYMFYDIETIESYDEQKKEAIIEIEKEERKMKKKMKKEKKKKPLEHTMEPKIFFANERTFIQWLQFSALIMSAALTLLNFGDQVSTTSGAIFFGISMIIAFYAFARSRYRAHQISTRPTMRYDDIYGPLLLCFLLVSAMAVNFALRWEHPSTSDTYLGVNNQTGQQNNTQTV